MSAEEYIPRCSVHRDTDAGWRCSQCKKHLCGACTAKLVNLYTCCHCDSPASMITEPRDEKPFLTWVIDAVGYPLRNLHITLLVTSLVAAISYVDTESGAGASASASAEETLISFSSTMRLAQLAILGIVVLSIVATSARRLNEGHLPMFLKTIATTGILWVPIAVYVYFGKRALDDELAFVVGGLAIVYVPAALASSATDVSVDRALNPFVVFDWIWRIKLRYVLFVVWTAALGAAAFKLSQTTLEVYEEQMVNEIVTSAAAIAVLLMASRMLGTLVYVHGQAFDWGTAGHYMDPIFPDMAATGARKGKYGIGDSAGSAVPIQASPKDDATAAREVIKCIDDDRPGQALNLYRERDSWGDSCFDDRQLLTIGIAAIQAQRNDVAVETLKKAVELKGVASARALFRLAKLHETSLNKPTLATELYRMLVRQYPESDVAREAKKKLG